MQIYDLIDETNLWKNDNQILMSLQKLGEPIQNRYIEADERPKAFDELGRQIQQYIKIIEAYKAKVPFLTRTIFKALIL